MAVANQQLTEEEQVQAARELRERNAGSVETGEAPAGTIGDQIDYEGQKKAARDLRQSRRQQPSDVVGADQTRARSFGGRLRELRQAIRATQNPPQTITEAGEILAEEAAKQAQRTLWNAAQEIAEDFTLSVWPAAVIFGFIPVTLLVWRFIFGNVLGHFITIGYRGFQLPIAAPYKVSDAFLRAKGILAYGAWGLEWIIIALVYSYIKYCGDNQIQCIISSFGG